MEIIQWVLVILALPLLVLLIMQTRKRVRALNERIREYEEEQEAAKATPGPRDPYADLASLFQSDKSEGRGK